MVFNIDLQYMDPLTTETAHGANWKPDIFLNPNNDNFPEIDGTASWVLKSPLQCFQESFDS